MKVIWTFTAFASLILVVLLFAMNSEAKPSITNFYEFGPVSGGKPKQIVLLLHGLGSDGRDLLGLAPELAEALPDAIFISPDAPFHCDMAPMGYQWFSLQIWTPDRILAGVKTAAPILREFMDKQLKRFDLPPSKIALVGFSQGTMMSLYVGPRYPEPIAGVLGYSGALVGWEEPDFQKLRPTPTYLVHGMMDGVVPISAYHHAKLMLEKVGFTVEGHTTPMLAHGIDGQGIEKGRDFLKKVLGP